jgi:hypothetical protein
MNITGIFISRPVMTTVGCYKASDFLQDSASLTEGYAFRSSLDRKSHDDGHRSRGEKLSICTTGDPSGPPGVPRR